LDLLPKRGIFSAAMTILDEKKRFVPAKIGPSVRRASARRAFAAAQQQKQSINHVGKETNVLRYGPTSTSLSLLREVLRAFARQGGSRSSQSQPTPARDVPANR